MIYERAASADEGDAVGVVHFLLLGTLDGVDLGRSVLEGGVGKGQVWLLGGE